MMNSRKLKKEMKAAQKKVANIALGYVPGATYRDLYNAIWDAEELLRKVTGTKHKKLVLRAHTTLIDMQWVREQAHAGNI